MLLWKQEIPWLFDAERRKTTEDSENRSFKALTKKIFFLTSKVVYDLPSIKWTSRKGNDTLYYYVILLQVD